MTTRRKVALGPNASATWKSQSVAKSHRCPPGRYKTSQSRTGLQPPSILGVTKGHQQSQSRSKPQPQRILKPHGVAKSHQAPPPGHSGNRKASQSRAWPQHQRTKSHWAAPNVFWESQTVLNSHRALARVPPGSHKQSQSHTKPQPRVSWEAQSVGKSRCGSAQTHSGNRKACPWYCPEDAGRNHPEGRTSKSIFKHFFPH